MGLLKAYLLKAYRDGSFEDFNVYNEVTLVHVDNDLQEKLLRSFDKVKNDTSRPKNQLHKDKYTI